MSFLYDHTEQLLEDLNNMAIIIIILLIMVTVFTIHIIFALNDIKKNIKDIRKITIKEYNESHPEDKFREENPYHHT